MEKTKYGEKQQLKLEAEVTFHNPTQRTYEASLDISKQDQASGKTSIFRPTAKVVIPEGVKVKSEPVVKVNGGNKDVQYYVHSQTINEGTEYTVFFDYFEFSPPTMPAPLKEKFGEVVGSPFHSTFDSYDDPDAARTAGVIFLENGDKATITFDVETSELGDKDELATKTYLQAQSWADPTNAWKDLGTQIITGDGGSEEAKNDKYLKNHPDLVKVIALYEYQSQSGYGSWVRGVAHSVYGVQDAHYDLNQVLPVSDNLGQRVYPLKAAGKADGLDDNFNIEFTFVDAYKKQFPEDDAKRAELRDKHFNLNDVDFGYAKYDRDKLNTLYEGLFLEKTGRGLPALAHPIKEYEGFEPVPRTRDTDPSVFPEHRLAPITSFFIEQGFDKDENVYGGNMWVSDGTKYRYTIYLKNPNPVDIKTGKRPFAPVSVVSAVISADFARPSQTVAVVAPLTIKKQPSLGDTVFLDKDNDGIYDPKKGDEPIKDVVVKLYKDEVSEKALKQTTTGEDGKYLFKELEAGKYIVVFETPADMEATIVSDTKHEKTAEDHNRAEKGQIEVTLEADDILTADAGFRLKDKPKFSIGTTVFEDVNKNGKLDSEEKGIADVKVDLYQVNEGQEKLLATQQTKEDGSYSFTELEAGSYIVKFMTPAGFEPSETVIEDHDDKVEANRAKNGQIAVTVSNANILWADAGFSKAEQPVAKKASIGDTVFFDKDKNGIKSDDEEGIDGIEVKLFHNNKEIKKIETSKGGKYLFKDLDVNKQYLVKFTIPDKYELTVKSENMEADKDANRADEKGWITIDLGETDDLRADMGLVEKSVQPTTTVTEPTEPEPTTTVTDPTEPEPTTTVTEPTEPEPTTIVTEPTVTQTEPIVTDPAVTETTLPSPTTSVVVKPPLPIPPAPLPSTPVIPVKPTVPQTTQTIVANPYIGTTVFEDENNDGIQNNGEKGIPSVVVKLYENDKLISTTKTDAEGHYSFVNLEPNKVYTVVFETPDGYVPTVEYNDPSEKINSNRVKDGKLVVELGEKSVVTVDAGYKKVSIATTTSVNVTTPVVKVTEQGSLPKTGEASGSYIWMSLLCLITVSGISLLKKKINSGVKR